MLRYHIWTIGCQMNKAESERMGSYLEKQGYKATPDVREADFIVLNSCVVRAGAENKVVNKLHTLKELKKLRPDLVLALTGCLASSDVDRLKETFPQVDYFFSPGDCPPWIENNTGSVHTVLPEHPSPSTFVPIMQGCDNFCSYCIVPYRRGRERSRPPGEIIDEVKQLARCGVKEVTLLGQNVDSYGHDLADRPDLAGLLGGLNEVEGLVRIRFLTSHPKDMSPGLIAAVARLDKVCEHISLPVQAGSNDILGAMRRGYTVEYFRELISRIRSQVAGVALSTDIIVGFPGESRGLFERTVALLTELRFDTVHMAAYSPRPGTMASRELEDNVPPAEKVERRRRVEELQEGITGEINACLLGEVVEVLVEASNKGKWQGRTRSGKLVFFTSSRNCFGQLVMVEIERTSPWSLQGVIAASR
ncbi:MAG: tRNA (N6-isopentenyl adenosine(37)-C2)-methylthiotransferase MiaB [Chloroflexota bacterium]